MLQDLEPPQLLLLDLALKVNEKLLRLAHKLGLFFALVVDQLVVLERVALVLGRQPLQLLLHVARRLLHHPARRALCVELVLQLLVLLLKLLAALAQAVEPVVQVLQLRVVLGLLRRFDRQVLLQVGHEALQARDALALQVQLPLHLGQLERALLLNRELLRARHLGLQDPVAPVLELGRELRDLLVPPRQLGQRDLGAGRLQLQQILVVQLLLSQLGRLDQHVARLLALELAREPLDLAHEVHGRGGRRGLGRAPAAHLRLKRADLLLQRADPPEQLRLELRPGALGRCALVLDPAHLQLERLDRRIERGLLVGPADVLGGGGVRRRRLRQGLHGRRGRLWWQLGR
eukprot:Unigene16954_Nuclearia_a/m.49928 Unigene16954_Nuclearia_a/g.49928  ORF Unigene16954_Nuclearia_a/g.49928 Unigene16954_Nuclearia_a/m.49928 type:complete len:347 (-) Unigene16954_Nuclearia_a:540-1580(-)